MMLSRGSMRAPFHPWFHRLLLHIMQPEPKVGLFAAAGGVVRLPRQIPYHKAMSMILTGSESSSCLLSRNTDLVPLSADIVPPGRVKAAEGYELGFVSQVVSGGAEGGAPPARYPPPPACSFRAASSRLPTFSHGIITALSTCEPAHPAARGDKRARARWSHTLPHCPVWLTALPGCLQRSWQPRWTSRSR